MNKVFDFVASNNAFQVSSRSHAVFIVFFEQRDATGETKKGKLNLVDLAGSEKVTLFLDAHALLFAGWQD